MRINNLKQIVFKHVEFTGPYTGAGVAVHIAGKLVSEFQLDEDREQAGGEGDRGEAEAVLKERVFFPDRFRLHNEQAGRDILATVYREFVVAGQVQVRVRQVLRLGLDCVFVNHDKADYQQVQGTPS